MPIASRLTIYNGALSAIGERTLMTTTENRESRRALDDVWDRGGVRTCLAEGLWNFAGRSAKWDYSPDITPPFGYKRAFDHPADWVRWLGVCEDEYMNVPLLRYQDESGFLFADLDTVYVRWVSDDPQYGMDLSLWPDNFQRYVELYFAAGVVRRLTSSDALEKKVNDQMTLAKKKAKSTDAMDECTMFLPPGTWSQSRRGRRTRIERGNRSQLIG
jgi:hypothetical protein